MMVTKLLIRLRRAYALQREVKNWREVVKAYNSRVSRAGNKVNVEFRNGCRLSIPYSQLPILFRILELKRTKSRFIGYDSCSDTLYIRRLDGEIIAQIPKVLTEPMFSEVSEFTSFYYAFGRERYRFLNVNGRVVEDLGAYYLETALYFLARGASRVIAYEVNPTICRRIEERILRYSPKLRSMLELRCYGVGAEHRRITLCIPVCDTGMYPSRAFASKRGDCSDEPYYIRAGDCRVMRYIRVEAEIRPFEPQGEVVKMNCEGCEYEVVDKLYREGELGRYTELGIAYHDGFEPLVDTLRKAGFHVKLLTGRSRVGFLYAYRR